MEEWRFLDMDASDACTNMAIDEAILLGVAHGYSKNTIRFFRWKPSAVSIGYFQSIKDEVDLKECRRLGVDVVRRITGGGAVYHDYEGELTYSIVLPETHKIIPNDLIESFKVLCRGIIIGLNRLGVKVEFAPINDLVIGRKKISGNAQTRKHGVILQHGTILLKTNPEKIFRVLKVSKEKISDKLIKSFHERVTNITRELGREVDLGEVNEALKKGFEEALNIKLIKGELNSFELEKVRELRLKYSSEWWNFQR